MKNISLLALLLVALMVPAGANQAIGNGPADVARLHTTNIFAATQNFEDTSNNRLLSISTGTASYGYSGRSFFFNNTFGSAIEINDSEDCGGECIILGSGDPTAQVQIGQQGESPSGVCPGNGHGTHGLTCLTDNFDDGSAENVPTSGFQLEYQDDLLGARTDFGCTFDGNCASRGSFSSSSDGSNLGTVPPTYQANGSAVVAAYHCVKDTVTASGASTSITLSGPAAFSNANYTITIENVTALSSISPTAQAAASFSFSSVNTDMYSYLACGV